MLKTSILPILAIALAAIGLALLLVPGTAMPTTLASYKYYVPGYATATGEPAGVSITPTILRINVTGDQLSTWAKIRQVTRDVTVNLTGGKYTTSLTYIDDTAGRVGYLVVFRDPNIKAVRLKISLMNVELLRRYFDYLVVYVYYLRNATKDCAGKKVYFEYPSDIVVKAILTLDKPSDVITLTADEFVNSYDSVQPYIYGTNPVHSDENGTKLMLRIAVAYEVKEKALFEQLPVDLKVEVLSVS